MRSKLFVLAVVLCAGLAFSGIANATANWYTCTINQVGSGGSVASFQLTDTATTPAFTGGWFNVYDQSVTNQYLAMGLTGVSMGSKLFVYANWTIVNGVAMGTISSLYVVP